MILSTCYWKENTSKMIEENYNYLVIDTAHLQYTPEINRFKYAIQVMDVCNTLRKANDMYQSLGLNKCFNFDILYKVAEAIFSEKPFNKVQLKEYYRLMREVDVFAKGVQSFYSGTDSLVIDEDVEMLLIGFGYEKQNKLERVDKRGIVREEFFTLNQQVVKGEKVLDTFVEEGIKLLEDAIKGDEINNKDAA